MLDEGKVDLGDGQTANELRKLKRYEFSFVPVGANQDTSVVAVKGILDGIKAGRVLSAKNETALREARDAIDAVLSSLDSADDQEKASGDTEAKSDASDEDQQVKSPASDEEPASSPSARVLAAHNQLILTEGAQ